MKYMNKKIVLFAMTMMVGAVVMCQQIDSTKKAPPFVAITGSVDAYYRYDFNNPKAASYNSLTRFIRSINSFELGVASIWADHSFGKVRMYSGALYS